ncbi:MAG: OsmC family protein [Candidatus Helarchaeales archaeon]
MPARAFARWVDRLGFRIKIKDFPEIFSDEPPEFHGDDRGPSSVEMLLAAVAACQGTSYAYAIQKYDAKIKDMTICVTGKMTHVKEKRGKLLRVVHVEVEFNIEPLDYSEENLENIDLAFRAFKKHCVVTESIIRGISADIKYKLGKIDGKKYGE